MSDDKKYHHIYVQHCYHPVVKRVAAGTIERFGDHPLAVITGWRDGYDLAVSREGLSGPWWYAGNVLRLSSGWKEALKDDITHCLRPDIPDIPYDTVKLSGDEFSAFYHAACNEKVRKYGGDVCGEWRYKHEPLPEAQYMAAARSFMEPLIKAGLVEEYVDRHGDPRFKLTELGSAESRKEGMLKR